MEKKFVTMGVFKDLISSSGINEVVAQKGANNKYCLFGLAASKDKVYLVKTSRGSNQPREWKGLGYLGDFIEDAGISGFTVRGLTKKPPKENTRKTQETDK